MGILLVHDTCRGFRDLSTLLGRDTVRSFSSRGEPISTKVVLETLGRYRAGKLAPSKESVEVVDAASCCLNETASVLDSRLLLFELCLGHWVQHNCQHMADRLLPFHSPRHWYVFG